jgi:hypothetical protein
MSDALADLWTWFADTQCGLYSPLYDRVCRTVAESDEVLAMIRPAPPEAHLPNVLLAAVHYLVLSGLDHPLAGVYAGGSDRDPGPLFVDVCLTHRDAIAELLQTRHTNTNEVGRSALLGPALTEVAAQFGKPLGLIDVGCSAGLNLLCDRYLLDYGPAGITGPADSEIRLTCEVIAGDPPIPARLPPIAARIGLDRDPVELSNDDSVRWQLACVWPDTGRLSRTRRALEMARDAQLDVVRGDAVDAVPDLLATLPTECVPVVVTTWAFVYLPVDRRIDFLEVLRSSSAGGPVAWISGEAPGVVPILPNVRPPAADLGVQASVLGLVTFSGSDFDARVLGYVHPHGRSLEWSR